jgi:hypothetical protein
MEYLFHYTKEENIQHILVNQTLKFNNIDKTNDPYENKMFDTYDKREEYGISEYNNDDDDSVLNQLDDTDILGEKDSLYDAFSNGNNYSDYMDNNSSYENYFYSEELEEEINKKIKEKIDEEDPNEDQALFFQRFANMKNRIIKTISFSFGEFNKKISENKRPGYFYPRMWAQYGNKSRGICLVFYKDKLIKEINKQLSSDFHIFANPINYIDILNEAHVKEMSELIKKRNRIFGHPNQDKRRMLVNNMIKNINKYFFTKDNDWKGEQEFRILIINKQFNNDIEPKIIKLNMSRLLHCVVLGENFFYRNENEEQIDNKKELNLIKNICKKMNISLYIIRRNIYRSKYILKLI